MTNNSKYIPDTDVHLVDPGQVNARGGLRTSTSQGIIECKLLHDLKPSMHNDLVSGAGSSITYLPNESAALMTCGTGATDKVIRQSVRPACYISGNPHEGALTGYLGPQKLNNYSRIGVANARDGAFFERNFTDVRLVIRSNVTGTPSDANFYVVGGAVPAGWVVFDALDGSKSPITNPSGITVNWTKTQFFYIDYLWQGVGTVRFGIWVEGQFIIIAEYTGANLLTTAYMANPCLPALYEIGNTGVTANASSMKEMCWVVGTNGAGQLQGADYTTSLGIAGLVTVTTRRAILAIRMAASLNGKVNNRIARFVHSELFCQTNSAYFEIIHCHSDYTATFKIDGITPATWAAVTADSGVEVSKDIGVIPDGTQHLVGDKFLTSGVGAGQVTGAEELDPLGEHSWISNNIDNTKSQMFVIYETSFNATVGSPSTASITYHEVE